ncbi:hypothetical protein BOTBODRAFT_26476 [Botryobasidium botryosum FD-172 SS1]|uniref:D-lactate dehydrogenase (cytochrome) n=1 Tax=Botryobasidium botryosum (strain FD-172 SS1) TaxID=930990 RepID=A0A067MXI5_BOTB1|nr:hypothetical protein BOTBODRAFT_26476 [Botryobasidium botryosum FD-172 SS1]
MRASSKFLRIRPSCDRLLPSLNPTRTNPRFLARNFSSQIPNSPKIAGKFGTSALALSLVAGGALGYYGSQFSQGVGSADLKELHGPPNISNKKYASSDEMMSAIAELREAFAATPDVVSTDPNLLHARGFSENSYHPASSHSVVVEVHSTEDVVKAVKIAGKWRVPVTAFAGGTSLEGHFGGTPRVGGICIDLSNMNKIIQINEADSDLICQAGTQWEHINETLKEKDIPLFFPLDPGPGATVGGMMGTGCSGTNAVRYGTAKSEWFLNATVVLPSGEVIKTRRRARKSSAGWDTTKLFIGAEGTLGIVTEVTLRLAPRLPTTVAVVQFPNVRLATSAVAEALNSGASIQCVELLDDQMMKAVNISGMSAVTYPEKDSLFFKFQGSPQTLKDTAAAVKRIVEKHGGTGFSLAKSDKEADDLWANRKYGLWSTMALVPGARCWTTDVCVPISRLPDLVYGTKKDLAEHGITSTILGHVGDGNFHALLLFRNDEELEAVRGAVHRMVQRALDLDGTCTGEHGVGLGKKEYLYEELGEGTVGLMKTVKDAIDPLGLFNPGKLYPDAPNTKESH